MIIERPEAVVIARRNGWLIRQETPKGVIELAAIVNGMPWYNTTFNADAADSISTDECYSSGSGGLSLTGSGVNLGIWDAAGVRLTHQEFTGRANQVDGQSVTHWHSTHVAGTMIASGVMAAAKGLSPSATVDCYDWNSDIVEMRAAAALGLRVSNHSYGFVQGWYYDPAASAYYWYGNRNVSNGEDYRFGLYGGYSYGLDLVAVDYPYYLICRSAGNDRSDVGPPGPGDTHLHLVTPYNVEWQDAIDVHAPDGDYDSITTRNTAKNILTVGAVNDVVGGYTTPGSVSMSTFSGWGPTDDGRIKPDIVSNGIGLYSPFDGTDTDYSTLSGTSMAAPSVAATTGDNNTDNVEQVVVYAPGADQFVLRVTHKGTLSGGMQDVSVLISGASRIQSCSVAGTITLDQSQYSCDGTVSIDVVDCDLDTNSAVVETVDVVLTSTTEPLPGEVLTLTETSAGSAIFRGSITLDTIDGAGVLRIVANDTVTATYTDADDGVSGSPVDVTDVATVSLGATMARIFVDLEINALDPSSVTRDLTFVITECTGPSTQTRVLPVSFANKQALGVLLDNLVATAVPEWISIRQGHTLSRLRTLTFDGCNEATVDLTNASHLHSGDFHTATVAQDGLVDAVDFSILASQWNQPVNAGDSAGGDATGDGVQDTADYSTLQVNAFTLSESVDDCAGLRSDDGGIDRRRANVRAMGLGSPLSRVDLLLEPQPRSITIGTTFDIRLVAASAREDIADQSIAAMDAVLRWDPVVLELVGVVDSGPYQWTQSGFDDDSALDGLNDTFLDGDAKYTALAGLADPAMSPISGLLVTTLRFVARASGATTGIWLEPTVGLHSKTRVFGGDEPNHVVTGDLYDAGVAVISPQECDGDGDIDLYEFHRLQACYTGFVEMSNEPAVPAYPFDVTLCCRAFDYDDDGDVDASDFRSFVGWATSPTP